MNGISSKWGFALVTGALALVSLQACKADADTGPSPSTTGEPPAASAPTPGQPAKPGDPAAATKPDFGVPIAANKCPSAAPGSTTTVKDLPDGIEVTVTAASGTPINDIRQRGMQIVAASKDPAAGTAADGLAKCPIVVKDTIVTETDVPGGASFTIKPTKAPALGALKKEVKARATNYQPELAK